MKHFLGEMTWKEAQHAYQTYDFVALVTASHEQHATHLPLLTDSIIGEFFAKSLAEEAEKEGLKILVLPTLWLGYSEEHINFPGTLSLSPKTLESIVIDVARCLKRHGVKRFLLINSHGGNLPVVQTITDRIERDLDLPTHLLVNWLSYGEYPMKSEYREKPEPMKIGHAGREETSMVLHIRPDLVQIDKMEIPKIRPLAITRGWWGARYWEDMTDTGAGSDPHGADPKYAEELFVKAVRTTVSVLKQDLELELSKR